MSRLFNNSTMSFLSMKGRNLGKVALEKTRICGIVVGMKRVAMILQLMLCYFYIVFSFPLACLEQSICY